MTKNGTISIHNLTLQVSCVHAGQDVWVLVEHTGLKLIDINGGLLAEHSWPPPDPFSTHPRPYLEPATLAASLGT